jgi:hypothetical protein
MAAKSSLSGESISRRPFNSDTVVMPARRGTNKMAAECSKITASTNRFRPLALSSKTLGVHTPKSAWPAANDLAAEILGPPSRISTSRGRHPDRSLAQALRNSRRIEIGVSTSAEARRDLTPRREL